MPKRSQLLKRRYRRLPIYRRKRKRFSFPFTISIKKIKDMAFKLCVWGFIFVTAFIAWRIFTPGEKIKVSPEAVAAFRVPHRAIGLLETYASKHEVPFAELFVLFCAENDFFPEKFVSYDLSGLEFQYVQDFTSIRKKYDAKSTRPYITMFENIFEELRCFPIPDGWEEETVPSYMFGDSWQTAHQGADIMDRENIRGRIPVVSMTDGIIQDAGYSETWGYHTGITTQNGTYYLYAHLDNLANGIAPGAAVTAGQTLGRMGNSGDRRAAEILPVHLHIGISPVAGFSKNRLWLNPYPLLRYLYGS